MEGIGIVLILFGQILMIIQLGQIWQKLNKEKE